nr:UvrD-like helicase, ATP-binding domain, P-loop containing nucleoside triphosphate hydrolase [Tanacetum cinerariifolium]
MMIWTMNLILGITELNVREADVEKLLVSLILDNQVQGYIDQVNMLLVCGDRSKGINKYTIAMQSRETRCELSSSMEIMYNAPFVDILSINESKSGENMLYDVTIGSWKNQYNERGKDPYHTLLGHLLILADGKPGCITNLQRVGRTLAFSMVKNYQDDSTSLRVKAQKRILNSSHMHRNFKIIKGVFYSNSKVKEYSICGFGYDRLVSQKLDPHLLVNLNESQTGSVMAALCKTRRFHISSLEQIWGLLRNGKTMTEIFFTGGQVLMVKGYYPVPKALAKDIDISLNHRQV